MNKVKDYLFSTVLCILILIVLFAVDDSYEDANLSAQVLDEVVAQANQEAAILTREKK